MTLEEKAGRQAEGHDRKKGPGGEGLHAGYALACKWRGVKQLELLALPILNNVLAYAFRQVL
jgi:hypothetical protein